MLFYYFRCHLFIFFNTYRFFSLWTIRSCDFGDFDAMITISLMKIYFFIIIFVVVFFLTLTIFFFRNHSILRLRRFRRNYGDFSINGNFGGHVACEYLLRTSNTSHFLGMRQLKLSLNRIKIRSHKKNDWIGFFNDRRIGTETSF